MAEPRWTQAQTEAIEVHGTNVLVSAAAGSGKTAVLVERVIRMVTREEDPADLDRLLVMTFTRAAAAQMKSKIYQALKDKIRQKPEDVRLRQQLMKVQNARICTIDSLCSQIVRDYIQDIRLDPGFRIAEEAQIRMLKKDVLQNVLEECYREADPEFLDFVQYYTDKNDSKIEEIILSFYRYAESHPQPLAWIRASAYPYMEAEHLFDPEERPRYPQDMGDWMKHFAGICSDRLREIYEMAETGLRIADSNYGPAPYAQLFREIMDSVRDLEGQTFDYKVLALRDMLDNWKTAPRVSTKNGETDEGLKEMAVTLRREIKKRLQDLQESFLYDDLEHVFGEMAACAPLAQTIAGLTIRFSEALEAAKKERNIADFSDIAHYALEILITYQENGEILLDENGQPVYTRVADQMAQSIDEIIVDEYQDTNMLQEYLVRALSSERFGKPNVFMVGDVKQSIYGFRMACPELFNEKISDYREGDAGRLIMLDRNFRSRSEILDFTNLVFRRAMTAPVGGIAYLEGHDLVYGGVYGEAPAGAGEDGTGDAREGAGGSAGQEGPEILMISGSGEQVKYLEGYQIARRIEELVAGGQYHFSDMVILTRSSDNPQLEQVLYQRGIPIRKTSGRGFFESFEIRLVLNLLHIIDNPFQDIPFAAVLYSPLCGASSRDIARIRLAGRETDSLYRCLQQYGESDRFAWFMEKLEQWRIRAGYMGVCDLLEYVLRDAGLYQILAAMPQGADRAANIEYLKARAQAFAQGSYTGVFQFLRYIRELQADDIDFGTVNAAAGDEEAVQMMTIHRSKGLEFPVVFLACSGKKYNETDINSSIIPDRALGLGLEYRDPESRMIRKTILMQTIRQKQKISTYAEEMRLLYVAMTRAKEKLIITGTDHLLESHRKTWEQEQFMNAHTGGGAPGGNARGGTLQPYQIMHASSYMALLGSALYQYRESGRGFTLAFLSETDLEETRVRELEENEELRQALLSAAQQDTDISGILAQCEYTYPFRNAALIQGKITASQLEKKEAAVSGKERQPGALTQAPAGEDMPGESAEDHDFRDSDRLWGAERGNAYHRFLELLDYDKDIEMQLEDLVNRNLLSAAYAQAVDPDRIRDFLRSGLGQRMADAFHKGRLFREKQFVMGTVMDINAEDTLTGADYPSDQPDEELLLVQGIIDAYFTETLPSGQEQIILVDYKTDKNADERHYTEVYAPQLEAYADALERSTGLKVAQKLIYSLELNREIEV